MLSPLAQRLLRHLRETQLIPPGSRCLIALSGGGDSVALTLLLHELEDTLHLSLFAVHLNHGLRSEAEDEARFVDGLCRRLRIPLLSERVATEVYAKDHHLSLEAAGRHLRYTLFAKAQQQFQTDLVLTAHTASDQAETVLMRLIAGTGLTGLSGIRPRRRFHQGQIVRPLLIFRGAELRQYLTEQQQPWCEDHTNHEATAPRTRIRLQLIPLLEQWNPQIVDNLASFSERVRQDENYLQHKTSALVNAAEHDGSRISIALRILKGAPSSLRHRAYRRWLKDCPLESSHLKALDQLVANAIGFSHLDFPGGFRTDIIRGTLQISRELAPRTEAKPAPLPSRQLELRPGRFVLQDWNIILNLSRAPVSQRPTKYTIYLNPQALQQPLQVRARKPGDLYYPAGGCGKTKLKKYLNSLKLSADQRDRIPLLCCGDELVWIIGYRADQRFLARPNQEDVWCLSWHPLE